MKLDAFLEAERRGILPAEKKAVLDEARKRGLIGGSKAPEQQESIARTAFDQGLQGATFGFADEITDRVGAGIASLATGQRYGDMLSEARDLTEERQQRQFEQNPVTSIVSNVAGGVLTGGAGAATKAGAAVGNSLRTGNLAARAGKAALTGAASGAAYGAGSATSGERLEGAAKGAALGAAMGSAVPVLGAGVSRGRDAVIPKIDDAVKPLVKRAREFDIPLRADQVAPTRVRKTVQKVSQEIPFSGVDRFEDIQRQAFTKAVVKRAIGQDADNLGPETITKFLDDTSDTYDNILKSEIIDVDRKTLSKLDDIAIEAEKTVGNDLAQIVRENVKDVLGNFKNSTQAPYMEGEKIASVRSQLTKRMAGAPGGVKQYLGEIVEFIDDAVENNLSAAKVADLKKVRTQWRNFKTIEPLLEESTDGTIDPTKLMNRVKSSKYIKASRKKIGDDDLVDLARIGKQFLPKQGGSDTFQKTVLGGGAGALGVTALSNPLLAAGLAAKGAAVAGANRAYQTGVNQSQRLIDLGLQAQAPRITNTPLTAIIAGPAATQR